MNNAYQITLKIYDSFQGHGPIPHAFVAISGLGLIRPVTIGYYPNVSALSNPGTVKNDAMASLGRDLNDNEKYGWCGARWW